MKKILFVFLICILLLPLFGCNREKEYIELGIPSSDQYEKGNRALCAWDLFLYDGKLYVGAGDYDKNAGPIQIWAYDTDAHLWLNSGTVPDEEVSKFLLLNGIPAIPGTDPKGDWSHGNYYLLTDGVWEICSQVENGIHMFDLTEYEGAIFAGLGVLPGKSPVVRSTDGGESFSPVSLYKDGATLDTSAYETVRVYDFFLCDGKLYALFIYGTDTVLFDLFRYEDGGFHYLCDWTTEIAMLKISSKVVNAKVEFKDKLFFTTGLLYATEDMQSFERIQLENATVVYDLLVDGGRIYTLSATKSEDTYRISVSSSKTGDTEDFREEFYFFYSVPPISFEKDGNTFYFGMGSIGEANDKNGMILSVKSR